MSESLRTVMGRLAKECARGGAVLSERDAKKLYELVEACDNAKELLDMNDRAGTLTVSRVLDAINALTQESKR